jgi:hypothetical protein
MIKDLIFVLNELAERGLTKENDYLYDTFKKLAYESTARAEQLLNLANPAKNSSENERQVAALRLSEILNDVDRPEFGYKELASLIIDQNLHDKFSSEDFLGSVLTPMEINILNQLIEGRNRHTDRYEEEQMNTDDEELKQNIKTALEQLQGRLQKVKIKRSGPRGFSEAFVLAFGGNMATFIVPVTEDKLGYKVLSIDMLIEDDFIALNPDIFGRRSWRA